MRPTPTGDACQGHEHRWPEDETQEACRCRKMTWTDRLMARYRREGETKAKKDRESHPTDWAVNHE